MKTRTLSVTLVALALLAYASPALAQQQICDLPPAEAIGVDPNLEVAYVPNRQENTISVVKVSGGTCRFEVIRLIENFGNTAPTSIFIGPDGRTGWIIQSSASAVGNSLGVLDTRRGIVGTQIPIAPLSGALAGAMRSDGTRVYVSNLLIGSFTVVNTATEASVDIQLSHLAELGLGFPQSFAIPIGLAVTPDDSQLWVTTSFPGTVSIYNLDGSGDVTGLDRTIWFAPVPGFDAPPIPVDVTFAGSTAHVVTLGRQNDPVLQGLSAPDAYYQIPIGWQAPDPSGAFLPPGWHFAPDPLQVGSYAFPFGPGGAEIVVPDTGSAWISNAGVLDIQIPSIPLPPFTNHVTVVSPNGSSLVGLDSGGDSPVGMALSPDESLVYLTNFSSDSLQIFNAATESPVTPGGASIPVGDGPVTPFGANIPLLPTGPEFTSPACGSILQAEFLVPVNFTASAETTAYFENETALTLSVDPSGLPPGATFNLPLPLDGTEVQQGPPAWRTEATSDFSWTPTTFAETGRDYVINLTATGAFAATACQVTIRVAPIPPPVFDTPPTPSNGETFQVEVGQTLDFLVQATADENAGFVTMTSSPLPGTATMTPPLTDSGSTATFTSQFSWTPELADVSVDPYVVTWTATDTYGRSTETHVEITVIEPGTEVPFDPFLVTKLKVDKRPRKGTFDYRGAFGLGEASDGIDPLTEDVTIQLDGFTLTIPAGSFTLKGKYNYKFYGVVDGVRIHAELKAPRGGGRHDDHGHGKSRRSRLWTFKFKGKEADLSSVENKVDATLQVGDDFGEKSVRARIKD